jgi:hypothetical protein
VRHDVVVPAASQLLLLRCASDFSSDVPDRIDLGSSVPLQTLAVAACAAGTAAAAPGAPTADADADATAATAAAAAVGTGPSHSSRRFEGEVLARCVLAVLALNL